MLLAAALIIPTVGALLIALAHRHPNLREAVTLTVAVSLFAVVAALYQALQAGARPALEGWEVLPGLALAFAVEPLGVLFALTASGLWIVTSIYSIGYMRAQRAHNQTRFYCCFSLALAAVAGLAFSANMFTLFIFYELLTLVTYPLVTHSGSDKARRGGRVYLGYLLLTSICLQLLAILYTWRLAGTLDFTAGGILAGRAGDGALAVLLLLYILGVGKAALMPVHRWLPAAMVAPAPVSALLHAVAVVKAGVFTILKVAVYIFGIDLLADNAARDFLLYVASATVVVASLIALHQDNLKARLAYSTVGQLAYIVLGAMLASATGVVGGAMHLVTHAFGKITLFFCAGAIMVASGKTEISDMRGLGKTMPLTLTAFFIGSLSIIGLPPMGGGWSKWLLLRGALETGHYVALLALLSSALLSAAYLLPVVIRGFFSDAATPARWREAPLPCLIALACSCCGCVALFFFPQPIYELARAALP